MEKKRKATEELKLSMGAGSRGGKKKYVRRGDRNAAEMKKMEDDAETMKARLHSKMYGSPRAGENVGPRCFVSLFISLV